MQPPTCLSAKLGWNTPLSAGFPAVSGSGSCFRRSADVLWWVLAGNDQLSEMAGYYQELSGLNDVLHTNHEHLLCESIERFWLQVRKTS